MKPILIRYLIIACAVLLPAFAQAEEPKEKLKIYLDNTHTRWKVMEKQDCKAWDTVDDRITLGLKIGNILVSVGPEITFGDKIGIDWNRMSQKMIARYKQLCTQFNSGQLTMAEYDKRRAQIEGVHREANNLFQKHRDESLKGSEKRARSAFDRLNQEIAKTPGTTFIKKDYDRIDENLDALP